MVAVIFDIKKWLDRVSEPYKSEITYLRECISAKDENLHELERLLLQRAGLIPSSATAPIEERIYSTMGRVRTWKDQKTLLEKAHKQRPQEYIDREKRFRAVAEQQAEELTEEVEGEANAG